MIVCSGTKEMLAELFIDLSARSSTPVIFIDSARLLRTMSCDLDNICLTRPQSTHHLKSLVDTKLERMLQKTFSSLVVISSMSALLSFVHESELPSVLDYVLEKLGRLSHAYDFVIMIGDTSEKPLISKRLRACADIHMDLSTLKGNTPPVL